MEKYSSLIRQWEMLQLIPRFPQKITAGDLSVRLNDRGYGINKRSVERDLLMFEEIFGLTVDDRSKPFGWSWPKDAAIWNIPAMNEEQALSLYMLERHIKDMLPPTVLESMAPLFKAARDRLKSTHNSKTLRNWPDKIRALPPAQPLQPCFIDSKVHESVSLALLNNQWLEISYLGRNRAETSRRTIRPLAYVLRGPMLYLVCRYNEPDEDRILAVCRIKEARRLDSFFDRPEDFSIDSYVAAGYFGFGDGGEIKIELLFSEGAGNHLLETHLSENQKVSETRDGRLRISATVADTRQLRWWILGFGRKVEVVHPAKLRKEITQEIKAMGLVYG